MLKKKKYKIIVNNKLKAFGQTDTNNKTIEINRKKHKGDKKELADTIKHEMFHAKHPKAHEKTVYKKTGRIKDMADAEQNKYLSKLRMKTINYKQGALKRKLHMKSGEKVEPGTFITKANESKQERINSNKTDGLSKRDVAIRGLV